MPILAIGSLQKVNKIKKRKYLVYETPQTAQCVTDKVLTVNNASQQSDYSKTACLYCVQQ